MAAPDLVPLFGMDRTFFPTTCCTDAFKASLSLDVRDLKKLFFCSRGVDTSTLSPEAEVVVTLPVGEVVVAVMV